MIRFQEADKARFINAHPALTEEQKIKIIDHLRKHPEKEKLIDWNNYKHLTYEDFVDILDMSDPLSDWADKHYELINQKGDVYFIVPKTFEFQEWAESKNFQNVEASWCIGHQEYYWKEHTGVNESVFLLISGKKNKIAIQYYLREPYIKIWNRFDNLYTFSKKDFENSLKIKKLLLPLRNPKDEIAKMEVNTKVRENDLSLLSTLDFNTYNSFADKAYEILPVIKENNYLLIPTSFSKYISDLLMFNEDWISGESGLGARLQVEYEQPNAIEILYSIMENKPETKFLNNFIKKLKNFDFEKELDYDNYIDTNGENSSQEAVTLYLTIKKNIDNKIEVSANIEVFIAGKFLSPEDYQELTVKLPIAEESKLFNKESPELYYKFNNFIKKLTADAKETFSFH